MLRSWGFGIGGSGSGCQVSGLSFGIWVVELMVPGLNFGVWAQGFGSQVLGFGFQVPSLASISTARTCFQVSGRGLGVKAQGSRGLAQGGGSRVSDSGICVGLKVPDSACGFESRVSEFGLHVRLRVSGPEFQFSDSGRRNSGSGFRQGRGVATSRKTARSVPGFAFRAQCSRFRVAGSVSGFQVSGSVSGFQVSGSGVRVQSSDLWVRGVG